MADLDASVFLKRAYSLLKEVEGKTESLRKRVASHDASLDQGGPFLQTMWSGIQGAHQIKGEKAALLNDISLAAAELGRAAEVDNEASIETSDGVFNATTLRAGLLLLQGQIELVWGSTVVARQLLEDSLKTFELPETYFMLGLLHENEYDPPRALEYYEKYLSLAPNGEFSVSALRSANQMTNYKKRFRGSWGTFLVLCLFCFPAAPIYFFMKRK